MTDMNKIADALDCFWNAAISAAHERQSSTAMDVASVMAEGFRAVSAGLRETPAPADDLTELSREKLDKMRNAGKLQWGVGNCAKTEIGKYEIYETNERHYYSTFNGNALSRNRMIYVCISDAKDEAQKHYDKHHVQSLRNRISDAIAYNPAKHSEAMLQRDFIANQLQIAVNMIIDELEKRGAL